MTITLGSSTLCHGDTRTLGEAAGPRDLQMSETPGVAIREYVGVNRVSPEHTRADAGTVSFGVTRIFGSPTLALAYVATTLPNEAVEGQLKFDGTSIFGSKSVVTNRTLAVCGCAVSLNYTIQG